VTVATVAVCVPTIPQRRELLSRAVASVQRQDVRDGVRVVGQVVVDVDGDGAAATRNRAWRDADPDADWLAFLDDDDELYSDHVQRCLDHAVETGADLVYPWFHIVDAGGNDVTFNDPLRAPVEGHYVTPFGVPFDDALRTELLTRNNFIPVTVLVRRSLVADVGGFPIPGSPEWGDNCCEDWGLWRRLLNAGAVFAHLPERTWAWHWHGNNTSGRSWKRG
jgi:glycosyltransferase involved in cell wall biosynthesis